MPIKDRSGGPAADDLTYGVGVLNPSAPVPGLRPPGDLNYRRPTDADSIYARAQWLDRTVYAGSDTLGGVTAQVPFPVYTIMVDNQTSQWLRFVGTHQRFIPPWFYGIVMRTGGENKFEVDVVPPVGITQGSISGSYYYTVSATEEKIPPSPGVPLKS